MNTHNIHFQYKNENHTILSQSAAKGFFFLGTQERVRNSHGKRAISVRATEILLYMVLMVGKETEHKIHLRYLNCLLAYTWLT